MQRGLGAQQAVQVGDEADAPSFEILARVPARARRLAWSLVTEDGATLDRLRLFRATLRACMRHADALRIDHVMGLIRLYWIPPGQPASAGAYVHYPLRELMAVVALESERNRCLVIGEDLGTVPPGMRAALAGQEVLSYRLFHFERDEDGDFKPPADYPREALVGVGTHDLPTLAGWWRGHDLDVRERLGLGLGLYPDPAVRDARRATRARERERVLAALAREGLAPAESDPHTAPATSADTAPPLPAALCEAVHTNVATTPSRVMMVQLEDALGAIDQANLPGTVDEHPNWRQKLPVPVERLLDEPRVRALCDRLARIRPHAASRTADEAHARALVPRATYRLQLHRGFAFDDAIAVLPYLARLGVSHVYCSPITRANPGSLHGYDVLASVRGVLARVRPNPLLAQLQAQAETLAWFGAFGSASLVALKLTAPGVPDLYQGNELITLSLVDPDNRRPVDYGTRARRLDELEAIAAALPRPDGLAALAALAAAPHDGRLKLWITWRLLRLRRERERLFRDGSYTPLRASGARADHVVAFLRESDGERTVTVVGRLHARLMGPRREPPTGEAAWGDTRVELPDLPRDATLLDVLTGATVPVIDGSLSLATLFATLPLAVLADVS